MLWHIYYNNNNDNDDDSSFDNNVFLTIFSFDTHYTPGRGIVNYILQMRKLS